MICLKNFVYISKINLELHDKFYFLVAIAGQTLILLFIRRSRLITNSSRLRFWFYGMMYYNLSDWLSVAWIAESNPSVRPLDVCSGPYISASLKHLLLAFKLFYSTIQYATVYISLNCK